MRVLVLGMCRTGTDCRLEGSAIFFKSTYDLPAMRKALRLLGYNDTYHGYSAVLENPRDCELWLAALQAKYDGKGKPFGRKEFDQILGNCQVNYPTRRDCSL